MSLKGHARGGVEWRAWATTHHSPPTTLGRVRSFQTEAEPTGASAEASASSIPRSRSGGSVWICSLRLGFCGFRETPGWDPNGDLHTLDGNPGCFRFHPWFTPGSSVCDLEIPDASVVHSGMPGGGRDSGRNSFFWKSRRTAPVVRNAVIN